MTHIYDLQSIETAPKNGQKIEAIRIEEKQTAFWFEGDLTAGWATIFGKPLGFEPTHWRLSDDS